MLLLRIYLILLLNFIHINYLSAIEYILPPEDISVIGQDEVEIATYEDTLSDIARRHSLGFNEIVQANPNVDTWLPADKKVILPKRRILPDTPREGIILNLPEMRIYYYPKSKENDVPVVITYPVSIGRVDWKTPLGLTSIVSKVKNPTWTPPETIRREHAAEGDILPDVVPAGENNPLGLYALRLGKAGYLIHGTDKPWGIGMRVTHGCMRLYPEDIEALFNKVPVGTPVRLVNQPFKAAWLAGVLYLQVFPPLEEDEDRLERENELVKLLNKLVEGRRYKINGNAILRAKTEQSGLLVEVGKEIFE